MLSCSFSGLRPRFSLFAYTSLRSKSRPIGRPWPTFQRWWLWRDWLSKKGRDGERKEGFRLGAVLIGLLFTVLATCSRSTPSFHQGPSGPYQPAPRMAGSGRSTPGGCGSLTRQGNLSFDSAASAGGRGMFYTGGKFQYTNGTRPTGSTFVAAQLSPAEARESSSPRGERTPREMEPLLSPARTGAFVVRRNSSVVRTHPIWKCTGFKGLR